MRAPESVDERAPSGASPPARLVVVPQASRLVIGWASRLWALDTATGRTAWVYGGS